MAYSIVHKPGTRFGPCKLRNCGHRDCEAERQTAATPCPYCTLMIGYDVSYCKDDRGRIAHFDCYVEAVEDHKRTSA
jgi:hypothetical protein